MNDHTTEAHGTIVLANGTARVAVMRRDSRMVRYEVFGSSRTAPATAAAAATFRLDPQQAAWLHEQATAEDRARTAVALKDSGCTCELGKASAGQMHIYWCAAPVAAAAEDEPAPCTHPAAAAGTARAREIVQQLRGMQYRTDAGALLDELDGLLGAPAGAEPGLMPVAVVERANAAQTPAAVLDTVDGHLTAGRIVEGEPFAYHGTGPTPSAAPTSAALRTYRERWEVADWGTGRIILDDADRFWARAAEARRVQGAERG